MSRNRRPVEVESLAELDALLAGGARSMRGWQLQSLDLSGYGDRLAGLDPRGALLLGCTVDPEVAERLVRHGALVFPPLPDLPFDPYRGGLYTPQELYDGIADGYPSTLDARIYAWSTSRHELADRLAEALHDHAIDDGLTEAVEGRRMVGVMGGHALARGSAGYRDAAVLGRELARAGLGVATGGGPGAMEAANLGAYLSGHGDPVLDEALALLSRAPAYQPSVGDWASAALDVLRRWPGGVDSLGVPTWFYGHEPPNPMATMIAKYFKNAIREDVLLQVCGAGIAFLPGRAGTVQEIFQDACENYYAAPGRLAPMVLVGIDHWTRELPAWPLLEALARDRAMQGVVHLVETPREAAALLAG